MELMTSRFKPAIRRLKNMNDFYFSRYVSLATGIMTAGSSTGTLILSPIAQALTHNFGWRNAFRLFSILTFISTWSGWMFKPLVPVTMVTQEPETDEDKLRFEKLIVPQYHLPLLYY